MKTGNRLYCVYHADTAINVQFGKVALWSANAGMKAIFDALNIIYDEDEKRGLIRLNLMSLFFFRTNLLRH